MMDFSNLSEDRLPKFQASRWTAMKRSSNNLDDKTCDPEILTHLASNAQRINKIGEMNGSVETLNSGTDREKIIETMPRRNTGNPYSEPKILDLFDNFITNTMKVFSTISIFGHFTFKAVTLAFLVIMNNGIVRWMKNNPALVRIVLFLPEAIIQLVLSILMAAVMLTEAPRRRISPKRHYTNVRWENEHLLKEPDTPISLVSDQFHNEQDNTDTIK